MTVTLRHRLSTLMLVAASAMSGALAGCGDGSGAPATPAKPRASGPSPSGGTGTIRGTISLRGEPPAMRDLPSETCHPGAAPLREETVVADDHGRLANVVVFLVEAPVDAAVGAAGGKTAPRVELDQIGCRYVPHVLAVRTNQVLRVKTSDPAVHNVHTMGTANAARNVGMQAGAPPVDMTFAKPDDLAVRCDIHPWMSARVHVFDHGRFAVTGPDGSFSLNDVPAGQYTLVFRHELFGEIEETIELADKQALTKDATYEKPGS